MTSLTATISRPDEIFGTDRWISDTRGGLKPVRILLLVFSEAKECRFEAHLCMDCKTTPRSGFHTQSTYSAALLVRTFECDTDKLIRATKPPSKKFLPRRRLSAPREFSRHMTPKHDDQARLKARAERVSLHRSSRRARKSRIAYRDFVL